MKLTCFWIAAGAFVNERLNRLMKLERMALNRILISDQNLMVIVLNQNKVMSYNYVVDLARFIFAITLILN